jgi:hypothetical protein
MLDERGLAVLDDLLAFLASVVAFSMFFASVVAGHVADEARTVGERLQAVANDLLERFIGDDRWTDGPGMFVADELNATSYVMVREIAEGRACLVSVRDLTTEVRWTFGEDRDGDRRTSTAIANVRMGTVDPAWVVVTVWAG